MNTGTSGINTIGEYAGHVYNTLESNGTMSEERILKEIPNLTPANVYQGIGWLAREGKLEIKADESGNPNYILQDGEQ